MYGDYDWMERSEADKLCKAQAVKGRVFSVENAGHHLYIENPRQCVANLLLRTHSEEVSQEFA